VFCINFRVFNSNLPTNGADLLHFAYAKVGPIDNYIGKQCRKERKYYSFQSVCVSLSSYQILDDKVGLEEIVKKYEQELQNLRWVQKMLRNCKVRRYIALEVRIYADEKRAFLQAAWLLPSRQHRQKNSLRECVFVYSALKITLPIDCFFGDFAH